MDTASAQTIRMSYKANTHYFHGPLAVTIGM